MPGIKQAPRWGPDLIYHRRWQHLGLERILKKLPADTQAVTGYTEGNRHGPEMVGLSVREPTPYW